MIRILHIGRKARLLGRLHASTQAALPLLLIFSESACAWQDLSAHSWRQAATAEWVFLVAESWEKNFSSSHALVTGGAMATSPAARPFVFFVVFHLGANLLTVHLGCNAASAASCRAELAPAEMKRVPSVRYVRIRCIVAIVAVGATCSRVQRFARSTAVGQLAVDAARRQRTLTSRIRIVEHEIRQQRTSVAACAGKCDAASVAELLASPPRRAVRVQCFVGLFACVHGLLVDVQIRRGRQLDPQHRPDDVKRVHGEHICSSEAPCSSCTRHLGPRERRQTKRHVREWTNGCIRSRSRRLLLPFPSILRRLRRVLRRRSRPCAERCKCEHFVVCSLQHEASCHVAVETNAAASTQRSPRTFVRRAWWNCSRTKVVVVDCIVERCRRTFTRKCNGSCMRRSLR